jgi:hypothetical protein
MAGVGLEQGIAVAAPFDRDGGAVEVKAFDTPDDVVILHGMTMTEPCAGILDLDRPGRAPEST